MGGICHAEARYRAVTQWKENREGLLLVNVLDKDAFRQQHIPGSINIPISREDFTTKVKRKAGGKDNKIVVYCASTDCSASPKAAGKLDEAGFTNVYHYEAGMMGWASAQLPTEIMS